MNLFEKFRSLLEITHAQRIVRRYFVVNGFDGALAMLGLVIGFIASGPVEFSVTINACLGTAIALSVSGVSSAYVSESAERRRALNELERTMLTDLQTSSHGEAARFVPFVIALTNGAAPLVVSLLIIAPLWIARAGIASPIAPLISSGCVALLIIFLFGVYIGRVSSVSWIRSGIQTLSIAFITTALIFIFANV